MSAEHNPRDEKPDGSKSKLRLMLEGPVVKVATTLHEHFPAMTANHITLAGCVGVGIGAGVALMNNLSAEEKRNAILPLSILVGASVLDGLDGTYASVEGTYGQGQLLDVGSDRIGEFAMAMSRAVAAHDRESMLGETLAFSTAITGIGPSVMRSYVESQGIKVDEAGKGVWGILGTSIGRTTLGIVGTVFPTIKGHEVQPYLDAVSTVANVKTIYDRVQLLYDENPTPVSAEKQARAPERLKFLAGLTVVTYGAAGATYALMHR